MSNAAVFRKFLIALVVLGVQFYIFVYLIDAMMASAHGGVWWHYIYWPMGPRSASSWHFWFVCPVLTLCVVLVVRIALSSIRKHSTLGFHLLLWPTLVLLFFFSNSVFGIIGLPTLFISSVAGRTLSQARAG